jgi:hypothetical protein
VLHFVRCNLTVIQGFLGGVVSYLTHQRVAVEPKGSSPQLSGPFLKQFSPSQILQQIHAVEHILNVSLKRICIFYVIFVIRSRIAD